MTDFDAGFADLKTGFDAVAAWNDGGFRDRIIETADRLPRAGSAVKLAEAYDSLIDELEEESLSNPAATQALDDLGAIMSRAMARGMGI